MSSPFVAEIRMWACNFAPTGWAFCNGQLLPISQNTALFSLLGTFYGGDGKSTFALPNFQGNVALNQGQSNTGTQYFLGQQSGAENITLLTSEIPLHNHNVLAVTDPAVLQIPTPTRAIARSANANAYKNTSANMVQMAPQALTPTGGSLPHNNMMPFLTLTFCIALQGVFPPRG
jgi:microcystin-dependent protein